MLIQMLVTLVLSQAIEASTTTYTCPGGGYVTQMRLSDYPPATDGNSLRAAANAKLQSAQRGRIGGLDGCCSGGVAWEVPLDGWRSTPRRGATVYDVTITKVACI